MSEQRNMLAEQNEQQMPAQTEEIQQRDITDSILRRVNSLEESKTIKMPQGYNPGNALKSAWLKLQTVVDKNKQPALQVCTKTSIINALFDMCIQGLTPARNQCYFIVRGNQLTLMRSYFGTCAVLKRLHGVQDVFAQVVYKNDAFEYVIDGGNIIVTKHEQKLENIDLNSIVGAYCVIVKDSKPRCEVMTMAQIRQAWTHTTNGGSVQKEYPDQMAKRTVINRGAKMYVNTCDDPVELIEAINNTTENEYNDEPENGAPVSLPAPAAALPEAVPTQFVDVPPEPAPQPEPVAQPQPVQQQRRRKPGF